MNWTHIIIHHSATPENEVLVDYAHILRYHTVNRGWRDIGYHAVVEFVHDEPVVILGRPLNMSGAHTIGWNSRALGICFVGNYQQEAIDTRLLEVGIKRFIKPMAETFDISPEGIITHRDVSATLCPGDELYRKLNYIRSQV